MLLRNVIKKVLMVWLANFITYRMLCPERLYIVANVCVCHPQVEDPCVLKPCGNRGQCWSDRKGNYNCVCKVGLTGKDCEKGQIWFKPHFALHTLHWKRSSILFKICIRNISLPLFLDLLPPPGLHVLRVEESEVELRWDEPEPSHNLISMFAVTYAPLGQNNTKTDYLERQKSTHVMRGLLPGLLYNISTVSIKLKTNGNDTSQPATALIRTSKHIFQWNSVVA